VDHDLVDALETGRVLHRQAKLEVALVEHLRGDRWRRRRVTGNVERLAEVAVE
jgi:hypothetical protein